MVDKRVGDSISRNRISYLDTRVKGGYMEKNTKKFLALSVLGMFMLMFAMQFVAAEDGVATSPGVSATISEADYPIIYWFIHFMGFGETWSTLIASLAVLVMIFAAAYDILEFSAFESDWVKYGIAGGIAVITAVSRGITLIVAGLMAIAGGSVALATVIAIVMAAVFFVGGSWAKGRMKKLKYKSQSEEVEGLMDLAATAKAGDVKSAKAVLEAAK